MANTKKKKISKEVLERWSERVSLILSTDFALNETEREREARIKRALRDYNYFCRRYFPQLATCDCGKFQIDAANRLADNGRIRALFEWARGHAKSTHIGCLIPLWIKARAIAGLSTGFSFFVVVSKSEDAAMSLLGDLQAELANNEAYSRDFGVKTDKGTEWQSGRFSISDGTTFVALGRGQSPRGLKKRGRRPDYVVVDDIDDDELCENEARVTKAYNWMMSALFGTMAAGRGRWTMVGNRINKTSILARYAERPKIYHTVVNILDNNGLPSWRENYTLEEIEELRTTMGENNFAKEYLNAPVTEGAVFRREWIKWGTMLPLKQYARIYAYTDPSWKSSTKNDYKATMLVGKTTDGYYHVLRAYAAQTTVKNMVGWHYDIEQMIAKDKHVRYWMESNLIQDLLIDEFSKEGAIRGHQIAITKDKRKKPDKFSRIESMQPLFERGFVVFNAAEKESEGMRVLVEQLLATERGSKVHDDAPDALEGAIWLLNHRATGDEGNRYHINIKTNRHY